MLPGKSLIAAAADVPPFDRDALIKALRADQAGNSTFAEFLSAAWQAGVIRYDIDLNARTVSYYGCIDEKYVEDYPAIAE